MGHCIDFQEYVAMMMEMEEVRGQEIKNSLQI